MLMSRVKNSRQRGNLNLSNMCTSIDYSTVWTQKVYTLEQSSIPILL